MAVIDELRNEGNERLKIKAIEDQDATAIEVLAERGNTIEDGRLVKTRTTRHVDSRGHEYYETVKVADGKIVSE